jgi:hypothetical protein
MGSKFGWVDFAEEDRQKMLDVIHLFRERDTRDELGIGTIRDAFSDYFFPGTSTIQTRIRYMLFIPWIYLDLERKRVPASKIAVKARAEEIRLIFSLLNGGEHEGVIGSEAKKGLKRLPSNIYWSGLGAWGIRLFNGSQDQYHKNLDKFYFKHRSVYEKEVDDEFFDISKSPNWHPGLPEPPADLMKAASLDLTTEEAVYLRDRILNLYSNSLMAAFLKKGRISKARFPWEHLAIPSLSQRLKTTIHHAWNFSEVFLGASLLYNLMLAEKVRNEGWIEGYQTKLSKWNGKLKFREKELNEWYVHIGDFWNSDALNDAHIPLATRRFVNQWLSFVFVSPGPAEISHHSPVRSEIVAREISLKRNRARLNNQRALEMWQGDSGTGQLSYRWATASAFISDILKGLKGRRRYA